MNENPFHIPDSLKDPPFRFRGFHEVEAAALSSQPQVAPLPDPPRPIPGAIVEYDRITVSPHDRPNEGLFAYHVVRVLADEGNQSIRDIAFIARGHAATEQGALEQGREAVARYRAHPTITEDIPL